MTKSAAPVRLRVGVVKYASCDGCQLSLLDLEDELLEVARRFEIVEFPEASSSRSSGPFDVLLVEGSISTPDQASEIVELRKQAKLLVTIGACASYGGIQALRNWGDHDSIRAAVYAHPEYIESLATATPVREHVQVDAELHGCPINQDQLREVLASLAVGRRPQIREEAVCLDCKRRGVVCVAVAHGIPCLGPVTQSGCGAICPTYGRGCYGCFGPREQANAASLSRVFLAAGRDAPDVGRLFAGFTAYAEPFRTIVTDLGGVAGARRPAQPQASPAASPAGTAARNGNGATGGRDGQH